MTDGDGVTESLDAPVVPPPDAAAQAPRRPTRAQADMFADPRFRQRDPGELAGPLAREFMLPPFSVLDARQGAWQDRKREWIALGIESEVGRGGLGGDAAGTLGISESARRMAGGYTDGEDELTGSSGTSVFDPTLCELVYRWFAPADGAVLDPFAGGSVRGIIATLLGRHYTGVELRPEQVAANVPQADRLCGAARPTWIVGDSVAVIPALPAASFDLVFSCPPYFDLEVYSDEAADLSAMEWAAFLTAYRAIIAASVACLRPDRFACFVIGDVRDPRGRYRNLPGETTRAFADAGCPLYNEAVLVTSVGSLPLRTQRMFRASRKLGKTHQNVLVFVKGDAAKAAAACGPVQAWWGG